MAALARFLKAQGMCVTGSDMASCSTVGGLAREGFSIWKGYCATQVGDADLLIYSLQYRTATSSVLKPRARLLRSPCRGARRIERHGVLLLRRNAR